MSGADLSGRLAALGPQERAELLARLKGRGEAGDTTSAGKRRRVERVALDQERLWHTDQQHSSQHGYHLSEAFRLLGRLDHDLLRRCVALLVERHESLRTTIELREGELVQVVHPEMEAPVYFVDVSTVEEPARAAVEAETVRRHVRIPFEMDRGPVLRVLVVKRAEDEHLLVETMHHVMTDNWSYARLNQQLAAIYRALAEGREPDLAPLPWQFIEFSEWQREWLSGATLEEHEEFWRTHLDGAPFLLDLPLDRPRSADQSLAGARHWFDVPREVSAGIEAITRESATTPFATLLAIYATLLWRLTAQEDLVVGVPAATRQRPESHDLIGFLLTNLPIRVRPSGSRRFRDLLAEVRESVREASIHGELPFGMLIDALNPPRQVVSTPYMQTMLIVLYADEVGHEMGPVRSLSTEVDDFTAPVEITLSFVNRGDHLHGRFEYRTALFDESTIERLSGYLRVLMRSIVEDPNARLADLPLIDAEERDRLLAKCAPETTIETPDRVHELVAERAGRHPEAPAVGGKSGEIAYAELDGRAERLADRLVARGARPGEQVGVMVPRDVDLPVAMLGVLKSGAAYVPLDPSLPAARLEYIAEDAGLRLAVTSAELAAELPAGLEPIDLGGGGEGNSTPPSRRRPHELDLAYVVYTSGSTGRPKGVGITHRSIRRLLSAIDALVPSEPDAVWALFHSVGFDVSVWEMWGCLTSGGRLVVVPADAAGAADAFHELLRAERVTYLDQTPSAFEALLVADVSAPPLETIKRIFFAGEELITEHLLPWFDRYGDQAQLVNMYGPSETTVYATFQPVDERHASQHRRSIGRPQADLGLYVLDERMNPVPTGIVGEIYLGGAGLARGYLGRPGLTAERFVADPFGPTGERLYRSGDRARWRADGSLIFEGRVDDQVQLRGFRIELSEVEAVLREQPGATAAAAVVEEAPSGQSVLRAFAVAEAGEAPDVEELRRGMRGLLPAYMVPATVDLLASLPTNANGKLDRRALLEGRAQAIIGRSAGPETPLERGLVRIWGEALRVEEVGVDDNFFDLGGSSLNAFRVASQAREEGLAVTVRLLVENQTIRELARAIDDADPTAAGLGAGGEACLSPQQRQALELDPTELAHWSSAWALRAGKQVGLDALRAALAAVLRAHASLLYGFISREEDGYRAHLVDPDEIGIEVREADLVDDAETARRAAEMQSPFDLAGPLVRVAVLQEAGGGESRLLIAAHHLVADRASWLVIRDDLLRAYEMAAAGRPVVVPPETFPFLEWARRASRLGPPSSREDALWAPELSSRDHAIPPAELANGGDLALAQTTLESEATAALTTRRLAGWGFEARDLLLSCLARGAMRAWGGSGALVEVEVNGRDGWFDDADLWRSVGSFATSHPVLLDLDPGLDPLEAARATAGRLRTLSTGAGRFQTQFGARPRPLPALGFAYVGPLSEDVRLGSSLAGGASLSFDAPVEQTSASTPVSVVARLQDRRLHFDWSYPERGGGAASQLIEAVEGELEAAAAAVVAGAERRWPGQPLTRQEIDTIVEGLSAEVSADD